VECVVATGNAGKLREFHDLLGGQPVALVSLAGLPAVVFPEEGTDYALNAAEKARAVMSQLGRVAVADDSGLEVDALDGAPGPLSARYGGPGLDDQERVQKLLGALEGVPEGRRGARFVCHVALVGTDERVVSAVGVCEGQIRRAPVGGTGFGYDPVFQAHGETKTMAEIGDTRKNQISHRALALAALVETDGWRRLFAR
jgi:XTP/dITP diphosphohydrolase